MGKKGKKCGMTVHYDGLPANQKTKFVLNDAPDVWFRYNQLVDWIRDWVSVDGHSFDGIKAMRHLERIVGYPLIEVELVYGEEKSSKFLIARASLYILAFFCARRGWRKFEDEELDIQGEGFSQMVTKASYSAEPKPWKFLGPKEILAACRKLGSKSEVVASQACQVFMVHLCEATRNTLLQVKICETLTPSPSTSWQPSFEDEAVKLVGNQGIKDILDSLKPIFVNLAVSVEAPPEVEVHIKKYRQLCEAWCLYILTDKEYCPLKKNIANDCGIACARTLRYCLAVLCCTNLDKLYRTWEKKLRKGTCPAEFKLTKEYLEVIQKNLGKLFSGNTEGFGNPLMMKATPGATTPFCHGRHQKKRRKKSTPKEERVKKSRL